MDAVGKVHIGMSWRPEQHRRPGRYSPESVARLFSLVVGLRLDDHAAYAPYQ
jgi:hypothetical protein